MFFLLRRVLLNATTASKGGFLQISTKHLRNHHTCNGWQDDEIQHSERQDRERQDWERQDKIRKARAGSARLGKARHVRAAQGETIHDNEW